MSRAESSGMLRDIFVGLIRVHLLHHAAEAPFFGVEMIAELKRHGYHVGPGTLYPSLHRLERAGFLKSSRTVIDGKVRRYYHITPSGRRVLKILRRQIGELVEEIIHR